MSVRPHPTHKGWYVIDVGYGKDRQRLVIKEGGYVRAAELEKTIKTQEPAEVLIVDPAIKDLILPFRAWYKYEVSARTLDDSTDTFNLYLVPLLGNLRVSQLSLEVFSSFKITLLEYGLSRSTINKHLSYISKLIKWAVEFGHTAPLGFTVPRYPKKLAKPTSPREPLTRPELERVYKRIQPHYRLPFLLMADMGLRRNEALLLRVEDVDTKYKAIRVTGKGNKPRRIPFMTDRVESEILAAVKKMKSGHLTINPKEEKPYLTIRKELLRTGKAAKLGRELTHHILRYTFATLCAEDGMNPYVLQKLMGHSSIETTMKIYTKVNRDFVSDEVLKIRSKKRPVDSMSKLRLVKG